MERGESRKEREGKRKEGGVGGKERGGRREKEEKVKYTYTLTSMNTIAHVHVHINTHAHTLYLRKIPSLHN